MNYFSFVDFCGIIITKIRSTQIYAFPSTKLRNSSFYYYFQLFSIYCQMYNFSKFFYFHLSNAFIIIILIPITLLNFIFSVYLKFPSWSFDTSEISMKNDNTPFVLSSCNVCNLYTVYQHNYFNDSEIFHLSLFQVILFRHFPDNIQDILINTLLYTFQSLLH